MFFFNEDAWFMSVAMRCTILDSKDVHTTANDGNANLATHDALLIAQEDAVRSKGSNVTDAGYQRGGRRL